MSITKKDILEARERISDAVRRTPLRKSGSLGQMAGCELYLKPECLQKTGAFKIRGALNKIRSLRPEELKRGVITASSGNHGQAVACSAAMAGVEAVVVMPEGGSAAKAASIRNYGAELYFCGRTSDERMVFAHEMQEKRGMTFVHPYDDLHVMAGQGTIGLEVAEDLPEIDVMLVPTGGGGLISGIATALKETLPNVKVYGVEPERACSTSMSYAAKQRTRRDVNDSIADGILTSIPGELTFPVVMKYVDGMIQVTEEEIAYATRMILERTKLLAEPTGAVTTAAVLSGRFQDELKGKKVVALISGGNVALDKLAKLLGE
ncbi:threonine/serine dehydratase [Synergistaceae bacterium OttesenSCG-928-D05]|nr:threonine/serine dehydratase [Synergistaceae bacterium OttesenSCG-928-D05]